MWPNELCLLVVPASTVAAHAPPALAPTLTVGAEQVINTKEQAKIVLECEWLLSDEMMQDRSYFPRWLQVLRPVETSDSDFDSAPQASGMRNMARSICRLPPPPSPSLPLPSPTPTPIVVAPLSARCCLCTLQTPC